MLINIKNQYFNSEKVLKFNFATSDKNGKNYLIVELDTMRPQTKDFVEVKDEAEFKTIMQLISNQLSN